ncbi:MAG: thiamine diphosphokinase [Oscillospiraceae bacterium]|nr:thiamine diphosphokinase [Oscillospiraceae bacterium]
MRDEKTPVCVILAGGDVKETIRIPEKAFVICADCGYRHALAQGITPDLLVGDFDSWEGTLPPEIPVVRHPVQKDETDTWLAVACGRERGYTHFVIYGAFGGERFDHSVANLQMLHGMAGEGLYGEMRCGRQTVFPFVCRPGAVLTLPDTYDDFSLFSLTPACTGVCITGARYPLTDGTLHATFPLGVSNAVTAREARISADAGVLLVIATGREPNPGAGNIL